MVELGENGVEAVLLAIVSRGHALIAELLRLSDRVPAAFNPSHDPRYAAVLFDLKYLKSPELHEERIEASSELLAIDDEFREKFSHLLKRFFLLFDGIVKYYQDLLQYLDDLQEGAYIQSTLDIVLENEGGRQLFVEALVLHGILLLLLEHRLKAELRERLLVAYFRIEGSFDIPNFDPICTLCRAVPSASSMTFTVATFAPFFQSSAPCVPSTMISVNKPEELFSRFPIPKNIITAVICRVQNDDLYNQIRHYPNPEHRGTALSAQAACLYILLYHMPHVLHSDGNTMREIVDKFFKDCWVIPIYTGFTVDLSVAWDKFKAAKSSLSATIAPASVRDIVHRHASNVKSLFSDLSSYLSEGVLTEDYVLNYAQMIVSCIRNCNVTLRWLLLHHITASRKLHDLVVSLGESQSVNQDTLLSLLLDTSRLEFGLKQAYANLLEGKEMRWQQCRMQAAERMQELSDFFSGCQVLSRKLKDENLQRWFLQMAAQVRSLDFKVSLKAGQKVQHMIAALYEVEKFHQIDGSLQTKQYLSDTRAQLQEMRQILNVQETTLATVSVVSDAAYAWGLIRTYTDKIHSCLKVDPFTVLKLQSLFLKMRSVMDIPLLRISQSGSGHLYSVSEYYSSELVAYVQTILDIIPVRMFTLLNDVTKQAQHFHNLPGRLEKESLRDIAQLDERQILAKTTHQIAIFSQGIMTMSRTFTGVIELDPRQLLEDGIRKHLMKELATALQTIFVFETGLAVEFEEKLQEAQAFLLTQKRSMEYFQDYVHIHGLQLWQEEFTRLINHSAEQECNHFLKRGIQDWDNSYQSTAIPIPLFPISNKDPSKSCTFMGRLVYQLLQLTDPSQSMYLAPMSGWFDAGGQELIGLHTFVILQESIGTSGMMGIDHMLSFNIANNLQQSLAGLHKQVDSSALTAKLQVWASALTPTSAIPPGGLSLYREIEGSIVWETWLKTMAHIGQLQLLRCLISSHLRAAAKVESSLVSCALDGMNKAFLSEIESLSKNHTSEDVEQLTKTCRLIGDLSKDLQTCGLHDPLGSIYITTTPPEHFALLIFLITIYQLPRYIQDKHLGTLTSRLKKAALDFCPLVVGLATLFQQFHSAHAGLYIQYLGQYVRSHVESIPMPSNDIPRKGPDSQSEVRKTVIWILSLMRYLKMPPDMMETCLPPIMLDTITS